MALIAAIVTDIEGTTSSLSVVRDVLAPYARRALADFVRHEHARPEVRVALAEAARLAGEPDADDPRIIAILERWSDEDRKATPLKTLQGMLWERGYRDGSLRAHLYPDVLPALRAFRASGHALYVYSSGSVHAQQLFFEHTEHGDLRALFDGYFDTQTGAKSEPASYLAIASKLGLAPERVLFLSDARSELEAARTAGFAVRGVVREPAMQLDGFEVITSFSQIELAQASRESSALAELCALSRHCYERGWASATSGNFSLRVSEQQLAITASGRDKGALTAADIVHVDLDGKPLEAQQRPSAETPLHAALYRRDPRIGAITHTHSVAATVLSRRRLAPHARMSLLELTDYEMLKALPGIRTHRGPIYLPIVPNSQDMELLQRSIDEALAATPDAPGYLVAGHGLTTWGIDLVSVKRHVEALEFLLACMLAG